MQNFVITTNKGTAQKIEEFFNSAVLSANRSIELGGVRHEEKFSTVLIKWKEGVKPNIEDLFWLGLNSESNPESSISKFTAELNSQRGIGLIYEERCKQKFWHNRDEDYDLKHNAERQLSLGALMLLSVDYEEGIDPESYPFGWDKEWCEKMINQPYKERLINAAALIAAELDRLKNLGQ